MPVAIRMPQPGQMTEECTVLRWHKREGDVVARGEPLFEIETDKSNMEVEAFEAGVLLRIVAGEGLTVPVDSVVAWMGQPGETVPDGPVAGLPTTESGPTASGAGGQPTHEVGVPVSDAGLPAPGTGAPTSEAGPSAPVAPVAPSALWAPSAPSALSALSAPSATSAPKRPHPIPDARGPAISPRAGRRAAELGIDVRSVTGSGPAGRVVERDIEAAAAERSGMAASSHAPAARTGPGAVGTGAGQPLGRLRRTIARRLSESVTTIPAVSLTVAVDMTGLVALRAELRAAGSPVTLTDLIHAATVQTLVEYPLVNSVTDGVSLFTREHVHLGIAVSVPGGLLVPVVRDADRLGLLELHGRSASLIDAARSGRLGPDQLSGSTFTVSNLGMFGIDQFTAIINPGESGILAVSSVRPEPAAVGGGLAVRHVMRITLSADHRLVDGELGARFVNAIRRRLQDPEAYRAALAAE